MESWKIIKDYNEVYAISTEGVVKNVKRGWIIKPVLHHSGYFEIGLSKNNKQDKHLLHRLLLLTFRDVEDSNKLVVNHKNGIKTDNRLENLEWCTRMENIDHSMNVLNKRPTAKLNKEQVSEIRALLKEDNLSLREIGDKFNIGKLQIFNIKHNKSWKI